MTARLRASGACRLVSSTSFCRPPGASSIDAGAPKRDAPDQVETGRKSSRPQCAASRIRDRFARGRRAKTRKSRCLPMSGVPHKALRARPDEPYCTHPDASRHRPCDTMDQSRANERKRHPKASDSRDFGRRARLSTGTPQRSCEMTRLKIPKPSQTVDPLCQKTSKKFTIAVDFSQPMEFIRPRCGALTRLRPTGRNTPDRKKPQRGNPMKADFSLRWSQKDHRNRKCLRSAL